MDFSKYEKPEYYVNRELSWLKFDERVLSEARDKNLPLFERLKFLSITSSNLDEFFMVRVASLKDQVHAGYKKKDIAGMSSEEQLKEVYQMAFYCKLQLLLIENREQSNLEGEKTYIIDRDRCLIIK